MRALSLVVRKSDGAIHGYVSTTGASTPNANDDYVVVAQAVIDDFEAKRAQMIAAGRLPLPTWDGAAVVVPADVRPYFKVESSKAEIAADGIDSCVLTFTKLLADDATQAGFNATVRARIPFGDGATRNLSLVFAAGVATKAFRTTASGTYTLRSNEQFRLKDPLTVEAYE